MLVMPCSSVAGAAAAAPSKAAAGSVYKSKAAHLSCIAYDEIGPHNIRRPLRGATRPVQGSPAPSTDDPRGLQSAMPRRTVLLTLGTGGLCAAGSMPAAAADAAKRRNLAVAEVQNIIERDFVEVRFRANGAGA